VLMGLARRQTQHHYVQLRARPKHLWVSQEAKPNFIELSYVLSLNAHGFGKMSGQYPWAQLCA
jgi:hypothetical protein